MVPTTPRLQSWCVSHAFEFVKHISAYLQIKSENYAVFTLLPFSCIIIYSAVTVNNPIHQSRLSDNLILFTKTTDWLVPTLRIGEVANVH